MTLRELCEKDVVSIRTGVNLGKADDMAFEPYSAVLQKMILHGRPRLFGLLGRDADVTVDWGQIVTIGADVVLVDLPAEPQTGAGGPLFQLRQAVMGRETGQKEKI